MRQVVEALIFASDVPLSAEQIRQYVDGATPSQIRKAIETLNLEYTKTNRAFHVIAVAGGFQMVTRENYSQWVKKLYHRRIKARLSQAALETLAIIAYRQPVTKTDVAAIRGVNCDAVVKTLLERRLINISGRSDGPGRPLLYRTTNEFLRYFGVNALSDLPKPREIEEIMKEENHSSEDAVE